MHMASWSLAFNVIAAGVLSTAAAQVSSLIPSHQANYLLENLEHAQYLRNASCPEVLDSIFVVNGLPKLGDSASVPPGFRRNHLDRSEKSIAFPIVSDGLQSVKTPYRSVVIETRKGVKPLAWNLTLKRGFGEGSKQTFQATTIFNFQVHSTPTGDQVCELDHIDFSIPSIASERLTLDANQCLSFVSLPVRKSSAPVAAHSKEQAIEFVRQDCSFGISFFKELKTRLVVDKNR